MSKFRSIFRGLPDPRAANALHELLEILIIALAAMLCGAKGATDMALFGRSKEKLLRQLLRLEHGVPSHDTFSRVFRALDPEAFEEMFRRFMAAFAKANGIKLTGTVAIDGKALRGAYERGKSSTPRHMVNVFATEARMALASRKAPGRNEAKGALEVLRMLSLEGCIVTGDALHCNLEAFRMRLGPRLAIVSETTREYLEAGRAALLGRRSPPSLAPVDLALDGYAAEIAGLRREGLTRDLPADEVERIFALSFALEQLQQHFKDLNRSVEECAAPLA